MGVRVRNVQERADPEEQRELEENHEPTRKQRRARLRFVFGGEQALDQELFGSVAGSGEKASADDSRPEAVAAREEFGRPGEAEVEDLEFVRVVENRVGMGPSAGDLVQENDQAENGARDVEEHLGDV